jgi:hypothetical protein
MELANTTADHTKSLTADKVTAPSTESDGNNSSSSLDGTLSSLNQHPLTYQRDLWDCMSLLNDNTWLRLNFIKNLRTFYNNYKRALETFSSSLLKANNQFEKDFLKSLPLAATAATSDSQPPQMIDTLN